MVGDWVLTTALVVYPHICGAEVHMNFFWRHAYLGEDCLVILAGAVKQPFELGLC